MDSEERQVLSIESQISELTEFAAPPSLKLRKGTAKKNLKASFLLMNIKEVLQELKKHKNPKNIAGMARFGINPKNTLGISIPFLRTLAKKIGTDHTLAQDALREFAKKSTQ